MLVGVAAELYGTIGRLLERLPRYFSPCPPRLLCGLWVWKEGCSMRWYANVLLPAKGPCASSALQALQIATSSVARAVWCGSGVVVDGKTEWIGAEVADGLVCFAAIGC